MAFGHFAYGPAIHLIPFFFFPKLCLDSHLKFLFLQPDDKYEFSEPARIQSLVKNYSQFVSFPIYTWQEKSRTVEVCFLLLINLFPPLYIAVFLVHFIFFVMVKIVTSLQAEG